jgi:ketosteroid isomerase-like protein
MTNTETVIDQFNAAFRERAPEKLVDIIANDCVMEGTGPAPDGNVWRGYDECLAGWQGLATDDTIRFEVEHVDVDGDRAVIRWRVTGAQEYRGVNLMRVRDGKIVEARIRQAALGPARSTLEETSDAHRQRQRGRPGRRVLR